MKALLQSFCRQRPFRGKTVIPTVRRAGVWRRRSKIYVSATLESVDGILFKEDDVIIVDGNDDEALKAYSKVIDCCMKVNQKFRFLTDKGEYNDETDCFLSL